MLNSSTKAILAATSALALLPIAPAYAEEAEGAAETNDIIVTARRVEERLQDVPISITVYDQRQLDNRNIFTASDLATYTPSLASNQRYGPDKASFAIRGFVQDLNTQPSVGVYFADVVGPRASDPTGSGNGVGTGNLFDLQNVQVLKGPQGTLFGRNTTGGAVLLVPQKPTDRLEGYVEGSVGDYDIWRAQGVLNIPLADSFRVRLGVDRMKRDGYLKNHSGIGPDRFGDVDYVSLRMSAVADLTPDLENYLVATYTRSQNNGIVGRVSGCITAQTLAAAPAAARSNLGLGFVFGCAQIARQNARGDGPWDVESAHPDPGIDNRTWQIINTTTWHASDALTIKNIASYSEYRAKARMSLFGDNFVGLFPLVLLNNTAGHDNASQSTLTEELQFQGHTSDDHLTWQAGGYLERSNPLGYSSQFVPSFLSCTDPYNLKCAGQGLISNAFLKTWFRNYGVYAQGTYKLTDQLSLTAGIRYTWDENTQYYAATGITFPQPNTPFYICTNQARVRNANGTVPVIIQPGGFERCGVSFIEKSSKPTWLIDLDYKPNENILLYAKYARGYRAGGAVASNPFLETWGPEKVDTYEVGAKTSFSGSDLRGYFNLAGFYNNFRDQQIQAALVTANRALFSGGSGTLNAGKSRIWGIEVDTSVTAFDSLRLDLGYTYLNTKLLELATPTVPPGAACCIAAIIPTAVVGGRLALSPKNRVTVTATYTLPIDDPKVGRISLGATFTHTDPQVATLASLPGFDTLPASDLLNLNLNWNDVVGLPVDLSVFVTNVTDKAYPLNVVNTGATYGFESYIYNEPRMFGVRVKYRFGS